MKDNSKYNICFDDKMMKVAVNYILNFTIGDEVFRQIIGSIEPFFDNLFLYLYERQWLLNIKKTDLKKVLH